MTTLRRIIRSLVLGGTLAVLVPAAASAATYYVSPSGSDANSGLAVSAPWRSLAKVDAITLGAGDQLLFQGGQTFTGQLIANGSGASGNSITYGSYGTGKAILESGANGTVPVVFASQHDVVFSNLIVDGESHTSNPTCVASDSAGAGVQRLTITGVEIRNCGNSSTQDGMGLFGNNAGDQNWTITNDYIHNTSDSCIIVGSPSHGPNAGGFVIQNNQLEYCGNPTADPSGSNNHHGIYLNSPGAVIRGNDIGFFQTDGISSRYRDELIEGNSIHDGNRTTCCSEGIGYYNYDATETAGQGTTTIRYNRIWNVPDGISLSGEGNNGGAAGPENFRIYNNTISGGPGHNNSGTNDGIWYDSATTDTELTIKNNIFLGTFAGGAIAKGRTPATYAEDYNDFANVGGAGNAGRGAHDKTVNPSLSSAPTFAPASGSPVISAGTTNVAGATYTNSCDGALLDYCGAAPDIGAIDNGTRRATLSAAVRRVTKAPSVPRGLKAVASGRKVILTWKANSAGSHVTHYNVYRTDQKFTRPWATTTATRFTNTGKVVSGKRYCYRLSATNRIGVSAKSRAVCVTVPSLAAAARAKARRHRQAHDTHKRVSRHAASRKRHRR